MSTTIPTNRAAFTLGEVARHTGGRVVGAPERALVSVSTDTRSVTAGALFAALRGERYDAHAFLDLARSQGAGAALVSDAARVPEGLDHVVVDDTLFALGELARAHRARFAGTVAAITGSAGKTTTKNLVAAGLRAAGRSVLATEGNLNNRVGVPMTIFGLDASHDVGVVEMGTSERGEIARLAEIGRPDVALVTRVASAHGEGLGGIEDVAHEKGALYRALGDGGTAIVNADDARVLDASKGLRCRVLRYGRAPGCDVRVLDAEVGAGGTRARFEAQGRVHTRTLALASEVAASNAAAALALALALGCELDAALEGIAEVAPTPGRMRLLTGRKSALVVDDTYNANPSSMEAAMRSGAAFAAERGARLLLVLGDMKELGADAQEAHAALGRLAAALGVAMFIAVGDTMRAAASEARQGGVTVAETRDASTAADLASDILGSNDVIVVKGSRSMRMERVVDALVGGGGEA